MKNYTKEEVKELLKIGSTYPNSVRYCEEYHQDFYNCLDKDLNDLFYKTNTLEGLKDLLENITIASGLYSTWFGEYFDDVETYEECVRNNDRIYSIIKYENLKDVIIVRHGDDEDKEIYIENFFDEEMTIEKLQKSINHQIEIIENTLISIEDYNNSIEAFTEEEFDLFDLALELSNEDSKDLKHMLFTVTQEQGFDYIREELSNLIYNHIEEVKKIVEVKYFKENLEAELVINAEVKPTKRIKL